MEVERRAGDVSTSILSQLELYSSPFTLSLASDENQDCSDNRWGRAS